MPKAVWIIDSPHSRFAISDEAEAKRLQDAIYRISGEWPTLCRYEIRDTANFRAAVILRAQVERDLDTGTEEEAVMPPLFRLVEKAHSESVTFLCTHKNSVISNAESDVSQERAHQLAHEAIDRELPRLLAERERRQAEAAGLQQAAESASDDPKSPS